MKRIRIAFLASTMETGGAEHVTGYIVEHLPADRFEPALYILKKPGTVGGRLLAGGVAGRSGFCGFRFDPLAPIRLYRELARFRPRLLFLLDHHDVLLYGRLCGLLAGVGAMIVASHSTGRFGGRRNFTRLDMLLMRFTDALVALSWTHARYLDSVEGIDPEKIVVIENGIEVERYERCDSERTRFLRRELGLEERDKVMIMVAALRPEKAHEVLFAAAHRLVERGIDHRLLIVGDGPRRRELEELASAASLRGSVAFLGERGDVADLLHLADVLVLPSHPVVETLPLVVLEAMAAGVPVVASAVGSIPEVVVDGETGILVPPGDPESLADALQIVLTDEGRASLLAEAASRVVRAKYTAGRMLERYVQLFERLAADGR